MQQHRLRHVDRPPRHVVGRDAQRKPLHEQDPVDRRRAATSSTARSTLRFSPQPGHQPGRHARSDRSTATSPTASSATQPTSPRMRRRTARSRAASSSRTSTATGRSPTPTRRSSATRIRSSPAGWISTSAGTPSISARRSSGRSGTTSSTRRSSSTSSATSRRTSGRTCSPTRGRRQNLEREVSAPRRERHLQLAYSAASTSRTARTCGCAACSSATRFRSGMRYLGAIADGDARVPPGGQPVHDHRLRRSRSGAALAERRRARRATSAISSAASTRDVSEQSMLSIGICHDLLGHAPLLRGSRDDENRIETTDWRRGRSLAILTGLTLYGCKDFLTKATRPRRGRWIRDRSARLAGVEGIADRRVPAARLHQHRAGRGGAR